MQFWLGITVLFSNYSTALNEIMKLFIFITESANKFILSCLAVVFILYLFVIGLVWKIQTIHYDIVIIGKAFYFLDRPTSWGLEQFLSNNTCVVMHNLSCILEQSFIVAPEESSLSWSIIAVNRLSLNIARLSDDLS